MINAYACSFCFVGETRGHANTQEMTIKGPLAVLFVLLLGETFFPPLFPHPSACLRPLSKKKGCFAAISCSLLCAHDGGA